MQQATKHWLQASALIGLGCLQMVGDLTGSQSIKAIGALTHVSPAPKVFTSQNGFETYSPHFYLTARGPQGSRVRLTPELNANVSGPYNRRNAYGAALSYGPVLVKSEATRPMFDAAFHYAFCVDRSVIREIGLPDARQYDVEIVPRSGRDLDEWTTLFEIDCGATNGV